MSLGGAGPAKGQGSYEGWASSGTLRLGSRRSCFCFRAAERNITESRCWSFSLVTCTTDVTHPRSSAKFSTTLSIVQSAKRCAALRSASAKPCSSRTKLCLDETWKKKRHTTEHAIGYLPIVHAGPAPSLETIWRASPRNMPRSRTLSAQTLNPFGRGGGGRPYLRLTNSTPSVSLSRQTRWQRRRSPRLGISRSNRLPTGTAAWLTRSLAPASEMSRMTQSTGAFMTRGRIVASM